jgi:hypothetical protein
MEREMKTEIKSPPYAPGEEFAIGKARYKVESVKLVEGEWLIAARRWIKSREKWSGNVSWIRE